MTKNISGHHQMTLGVPTENLFRLCNSHLRDHYPYHLAQHLWNLIRLAYQDTVLSVSSALSQPSSEINIVMIIFLWWKKLWLCEIKKVTLSHKGRARIYSQAETLKKQYIRVSSLYSTSHLTYGKMAAVHWKLVRVRHTEAKFNPH